MSRLTLLGCASLGALVAACPALAQSSVPIPEIVVTGADNTALGPVPIKDRYQLPQTAASTTAERIEETVNVVDTQDAVKYLPSLTVRKRNYGDNQSVLASRVWGLNSSARTMIFVDDILISNYQGNNNSNASPRWGMVAPEEIKRIDFLYGPFAAMYPGNSMGGVLNITTRMPDKFEATLKQSESFQRYSFYNTSDTYRTDQTSATIGNRWGDLSAFASINYQNSYSQPLGWATTSSASIAGTTGLIPQLSRTGTTANVMGATGLLHTEMVTTKGKATLDITPWLTAAYTVGLWSNDQKSRVETYLRTTAGVPTYGPQTTSNPFASGTYDLKQVNLANALSLKTDTKGAFDWDIVVSRTDYLTDIQRNPFNVTGTGTSFIDTGRIARLDGTNWMTFDARGIWRVANLAGSHEVSFGVHGDRYVLENPVYRTTTWFGGPDATSEFYSRSQGKTQTGAVWLQDAWRFAEPFKLTLGGRWETWRAFDGFNLNTGQSLAGAITSTTTINQPTLNAERFSPKASLAFEPNRDWLATASVGIANRFPTVTELYQIATVSGVLINPNPNLKPERSLASELAIERRFPDGKVRLSLFQEDTSDMLVSQQNFIPGTTTLASFVTNVDKVRNRGVELAWQKNNIPVPRVEVFGSITYVDSKILSDPMFVGTGGSTAVGKRVPNVPMWRGTLGATWRPDDAWAVTLVGRYQSKLYATLDNIDNVPNVYQAFDPFLVVDTRIQYQVNERGSLAFGIDNVFNEKYHLFHPFPQRTYVLQGRLKL